MTDQYEKYKKMKKRYHGNGGFITVKELAEIWEISSAKVIEIYKEIILEKDLKYGKDFFEFAN